MTMGCLLATFFAVLWGQSPEVSARAHAGYRKLFDLGKEPVAVVKANDDGSATIRLAPDGKTAEIVGATIMGGSFVNGMRMRIHERADIRQSEGDRRKAKVKATAAPPVRETVVFNVASAPVNLGDFVLATGECASVSGGKWARFECELPPAPPIPASVAQRYERQIAEAKLREAEGEAVEIQTARTQLETLETRAQTPAIRALELKVDQMRADLIAAKRDPDAMNRDVAAALVELETARNNALTPEIAAARVRLNTLQNLALTDEVQRARDKTEILTNMAVTPQKAAAMLASEQLLQEASTSQLVASRERRDTLMAEAAAKHPDTSRGKAHAAEVRSRVSAQELTESRQRVEQLMAAARSAGKR